MFILLILEKNFYIVLNPTQVNLIKMISNVNISKKNGIRQNFVVTSG